MVATTPRRLLVVNPNTSAGITETYVAQARSVAPPDTVIDGVTGAFGAAIVSTQAENVVAAHAALDLLARHAGGYDAAILAISFDSGLDAARELLPIPVIGMTRATLEAAAASDRRIGMIVFGAMSLPLYEHILARYAPDIIVAAVEVVAVDTAAGYLDGATRDQRALAAMQRLVREEAVDAIAVCGAAIVGMARRLQPLVPVPLFDGAACAVKAALQALDGGGGPFVRVRPLSACTGISLELARLIAGEDDAPHRSPGAPA